MSGTTILIVVVALAVIALVLAVVFGIRNRRGRGLRERFGPEYDRTVQETGSRQEAERVLSERVERHRDLDLKELEPAARARYVEEWRQVQLRFVDDPSGAVGEADDLVTSLMRELGYPTESYEQQVADVSVEHAEATPHYRQAHELATARGQVATDDLRQAMVHYRTLFEDLAGAPAWRPNGAAERAEPSEPGGPVPAEETPAQNREEMR
jgi:FtsZ-interacting cell division protein ZipA